MESAGTKYLELALSRQRPWVRIGRAALLMVFILAPIAAGLIGHRFGYFDGVADTYLTMEPTHPVWTDQEVRSIGNGVQVSVICTTHDAAGALRINTIVMNAYAVQQKGRICDY